ncbi:hypothetical protein C8J57DRAFT_1234367 [Mycena rebaudengoi]|nr:hypothetical protein C8J57DRAFT_1234367 [Mycena rebaudengoi]
MIFSRLAYHLQMRKMFFGALGIRKTQEATNPEFKLTRACATVLVYDETKTRMDEALERLWKWVEACTRGPDIIANTFLAKVTDKTPEVCPLGAMSLYFHWLHDLYKLPKKMSIDWESNKSWRTIRLLFGADPVVPFNENSLYSLYCMAYMKSDFESNIKQHLPRHILRYLQEKIGSDTAKLGWSQGTYMDTYAPALPKNVHENYDPIWRHVRVPEAFLSRMCPNAESILEKIEGEPYLTVM